MLSFCPRKKSFTKLEKLNHSRHSHTACELDGKLYVFGGLTKFGKYVTSVERTNFVAQESKWTDLTLVYGPHLLFKASNLLACDCDNEIMVLHSDEIYHGSGFYGGSSYIGGMFNTEKMKLKH